MRAKWPDEINEFLREFVPGHTVKECSAAVFDRFGVSLSAEQIKGWKFRYHVKSGTICGVKKGEPTKKYPIEVMQFIEENHKGVGEKKMAARLNETFGTNYTVRQIKAFYHNHGLNSGLTGRFEKGHVPPNKGKKGMPMHPNAQATQFKMGHTPANKKPIGTVMVKNDGYLWRKIGEGCREWRQEHILRWEEVNGPIPKGMMLIFLDGNRMNVDVNNLLPVERKVWIEMIRRGLRFDNADLTRTGALIAELNAEIFGKTKKGRRKGE